MFHQKSKILKFMFLCQSGHSVENRYGKTNKETTAVTQTRYWGVVRVVAVRMARRERKFEGRVNSLC